MERQTFNKQIHRLKTQWPHSYGEERIARIWTVFQRMSDQRFIDIIDMAIDTMRSAPLCEDLGKLEIEVSKRESYNRVQSDASIVSILLDKAQQTSPADKDFVQACLSHLRSKLSGKIDMETFLTGCDEIDTVARQLSSIRK